MKDFGLSFLLINFTSSSMDSKDSESSTQTPPGETKENLLAHVVECVQLKIFSLHLSPGTWYDPKTNQYHEPGGPIGRRGPSGPGIPDELPPWVYTKPSCALLSFTLDGDIKEKFEELKSAVLKLAKVDHIQIKSIPSHPPEEVRITPKDEHKEDIEKFQKEEAERLEKIDSLVHQLEELGCYCDELGVPRHSPKEEWFNIHKTPVYKGMTIQVFADGSTALYKALDEKGLIEAAVPEWYKTGNF